MIKFIIFILIQFIYSQDKGLSSFEKENYKESFEYYLKVLESRENDISAKFGAGISAFKNQEIETGMKYYQVGLILILQTFLKTKISTKKASIITKKRLS